MHFKKYLIVSIFYSLLVPLGYGSGWVTQQPPVLATLSSAKRNNVFYVGTPVVFTVTSQATSYAVRDYYGTLIDQGAITGTGSPITFTVNASNPGWYKLYLYGVKDQGSPWGTAVGGTNFVIFRNNPNFPAMPAAGTSGGGNAADDDVVRGVTAIGPERLAVTDASNPTAAIASLEQEIAILEALYAPYDPIRTRPLLIAFPNGTQNTAGVQQIVQHFKDKVQYWEGRNEPNSTYSGADFVTKEEQPFYQLVKAVDPTLQVLGPAIVSVDPNQAGWINSFLQAGGSKCIDAFSFHAYNCVNGDWWLISTSINSVKAQLAAAGAPNLPLWQTEQGYMAAVYGSFQPRLQGRWTMLQMMGYEQFGIPKEHNHLWYDVSHGYWDEPMWWENSDGSLNPAAALMRVWSEELFGLQYAQAFDFGSVDDNLYLGDLFTSGTKSVAAFMTAGNPYGSVNLSVCGGDHIHVVSPFGVESDLPIVAGAVQLPVSELPVYVELQQGQTCQVVARTYGANLAVQTGVVVTASGAAGNPVFGNVPNDPSKIVSGKLVNWYWSFAAGDHPWMSNVSSWPATVEIDLPSAAPVSDVVIQAAVPWQCDGTLLDYELQYWDGSAWDTIEHVTEPTNTWNVYSPVNECSVDSFFSDRCVFEHHFSPVTTNRIRLLVNDVTYGGGATAAVAAAGGQTGVHQITLRQVSIFRQPAAPPVILTQPVSQVIAPGGSTTLTVSANASPSATYQWMKDGVTIQNSSSPALAVTNASSATQGNYSVNVVDTGGTVASNSALILLNTPVNTWIIKYFPQTTADGITALLESVTNDDNICNLQKYCFDLVPGASGNLQNLPQVTMETDGATQYLVLSYTSNPAATDVQVIPEASTDLSTSSWSGITPDVITTAASGQPDGALTTQMKFQIAGASAKFLRLELVLPQP